MIDLTDICGIPVYLDEETGSLHYGEEIVCTHQRNIGLKEIIPILLNKFLKYPEQVYKHYIDLKDSGIKNNNKEISYDIFQLPNGLLGIEYLKTHVYRSDLSDGMYSCIIEVTKGELTVLMQENEYIDDPFAATPVNDVKIVILYSGDRFAIPTGVLYTFINTSSDQVVFVVISNNLSHLDYTKSLIKEKGLSYFIISKNARLEVVANPKYKIKKPIEKYNFKEMPKDVKSEYINDYTESSDPMYGLFANNYSELATVLA